MTNAYPLSKEILEVWSVVEYPFKGIYDIVQHFDGEPNKFFFCFDLGK